MQNDYEKARIAVDSVILTMSNEKLKILLHKREKNPYKSKFELIGGLLRKNETARDTLSRKIKEFLAIDNVFFQQFYTFTDPNRDPRFRVISIGFITLINNQKIKDFSNWYEINEIKELAFDHRNIIKKALEYLKNNLDSEIIKHFMPEYFPLNKLQKVYELILGIKYDNRNFRKRVLNSEIIFKTKEIEKNVSHRPAKLYKFAKRQAKNI